MNQKKNDFLTTKKNEIEEILKKYPKKEKKSAMLPLLHLAQKNNDGWLDSASLKCVAHVLDVSEEEVFEVISFYSLFFLMPQPKYCIQFCHSISCQLRSSDQLIKTAQEWLKNNPCHEKNVSIKTVECIGHCVGAACMSINDQVYEKVNEQELIKILNNIN
jgi:NADH-quinone oxidoreductase subunit E